MSSERPGPVVCFSYLAAAELWKVARFPLANDGAEVVEIEHSIAADGPMAAAVLAALGVPSLLLSNGIGSDVRGVAVRDWLQPHQVATAAPSATGLTTPQIVVVADEASTRTWFPHLPGVADALAAVDLSPLTSAAFAYIDCYQLIEAPAVRAIHAARAADVPVLLNLGGSPLSPVVTAAVRDHPNLFMQTNVDDVSHAEAPRVAALILAATNAQWVVVTAGAYGVVALSRSEFLSVPAYRVVVRHTHCAGAAFSGGLLYGLLHDWPMTESLHLACASGALRCERGHGEPLPTLVELGEVIASAGRPAEIQSRSVAAPA
jgi:sugar/nucleoside kinase (ribokinase family)